jgi:hypothetical protein
MATRRVTTVTCADDMNRLKGYRNLDAFIDHVQNQTDLEVTVTVEKTYVSVEQEDGQQNNFSYPFAAQDIVDWTYDAENDNNIRYEIQADVERILDVPVYEGETADEERDEQLRTERAERVLEFLNELLFGFRWIGLDGVDLLVMDPKGGPLELTACFMWDTPTSGLIGRPYRPENRPAVARLYCDGLLALTWPSEADDPPVQDGVQRPLRDLVVVDLAIVEDAIELYDEARGAFWEASRAAKKTC